MRLIPTQPSATYAKKRHHGIAQDPVVDVLEERDLLARGDGPAASTAAPAARKRIFFVVASGRRGVTSSSSGLSPAGRVAWEVSTRRAPASRSRAYGTVLASLAAASPRARVVERDERLTRAHDGRRDVLVRSRSRGTSRRTRAAWGARGGPATTASAAAACLTSSSVSAGSSRCDARSGAAAFSFIAPSACGDGTDGGGRSTSFRKS